MRANLRKTIANVSQNKRVRAVALEVINGKASVRIAGSSKPLYGLPITGGDIVAGQEVYVDYTTGQPVVHSYKEDSPTQQLATRVRTRFIIPDPDVPKSGSDHTHTETQILDLSHNAIQIRGKTVTTGSPVGENIMVFDALTNQWQYSSGSRIGPKSHAEVDNFYLQGYDPITGLFSSGSVISSGSSGGIEEAPIDGKQYARKNAGWEEVVASSGSASGFVSADEFVDQSSGSGAYGILVGNIDGNNTDFTVSQEEYITGTLKIYRNGQLQTQSSGSGTGDWMELSPEAGTFQFHIPPEAGDVISAIYKISSGILIPETHEAVEDFYLTGYDAETGLFTSGSIVLNDLSDVDTSGSLIDGQLLEYNSGSGLWMPHIQRLYRASQTAAQSISTTPVRINYDNVAEDLDGAITTGSGWKFTAPRAGYYMVSASAARANSGEIFIRLIVNGTQYSKDLQRAGASSYVTAYMTQMVYMNIGDTLYVTLSAASGTYNSFVGWTWIQILRL